MNFTVTHHGQGCSRGVSHQGPCDTGVAGGAGWCADPDHEGCWLGHGGKLVHMQGGFRVDTLQRIPPAAALGASAICTECEGAAPYPIHAPVTSPPPSGCPYCGKVDGCSSAFGTPCGD